MDRTECACCATDGIDAGVFDSKGFLGRRVLFGARGGEEDSRAAVEDAFFDLLRVDLRQLKETDADDDDLQAGEISG